MSDPILVTGVAGFIGFHTAYQLLQRGETVVGIDSLTDYYDVNLKQDRLAQFDNFTNFTFIKQDIADKEGLEKIWAEHGPFKRVIHLAAQPGVRYSLTNPYSYVTSNCMGHLTILEMCRHTEDFQHLVYASSSSVYGGNTKTPFAVSDEINKPISLYAATKASCELMSHSYAHLYGIKQTGLRFFTVYGPWNRPDMAMFIFTKAIDEGRKVPIFNHGNMKRDFTYIDDIVDGVISCLANPPDGENGAPARVLNIGNTRGENLMDFVKLIEQELGKKADIEYLDMQPGDIHETFADIDETTRLTGFSPKTAIDVGVPRFVAWYKDYYKKH